MLSRCALDCYFVALGPLLDVFGAQLGASWAPLGASWAALGANFALLARSWPLLGRSWPLLGRSWDALGTLLAALGAILDKHQQINQKTTPKMSNFGSQKGARREPKSNKKPTKIEHKNRCEKNTSSRSSWSRLGAILGHFGGRLGSQKSYETVCFKAFRENSRFSKNSVSRAVLSPT